jgi:hypothetical protein
MKTSELTGLALDWAVAKCEKLDVYLDYIPWQWIDVGVLVDFSDSEHNIHYQPSTHWGWAGPIIEREGIQIQRHASGWIALPPDTEFSEEAYQEGETPLVAAMRCYVASKFGDEIEIPEELK